jgi:hypothetical protein
MSGGYIPGQERGRTRHLALRERQYNSIDWNRRERGESWHNSRSPYLDIRSGHDSIASRRAKLEWRQSRCRLHEDPASRSAVCRERMKGRRIRP